MTQYMTPAFGSSHFLLALVIGACGAIGLLHFCLWQRGRTDTTHLWVAGFCGSSVVFLIGRYLVVQAQSAPDAIVGGRIEVATAPVIIFCLLSFARSLNQETKGWALYVSYSLVAGLLSVVGASTEFMITDQVFDSVDSFGYRHVTPLGGVGVILLAAFALPTYVHLVVEIRRSPTISTLEKRVVLGSVLAFALSGALAAASAIEAIRIPSLVQYTLFVIAAGLSFLLVHQHVRMRADLEAMADERARKLKLSDLRYEQLVQDAPVGIFALDAKGRLRAINGRLCSMLGVPEEVREHAETRQGFLHALPQLHASGIAEQLDACLETGRPFSDEFEWEGADQTSFAVRAQGVAILDPAGEIVGVQAIVEDIAERRALEERVRLSQKMDAVGGLAAGIAHEINNPMSYVRANLGMIDDELARLAEVTPGESPLPDASVAGIRELVADVTEGVERTVDIVRDVNEFARGLEQHRSEADVNEVIQEALRRAAC